MIGAAALGLPSGELLLEPGRPVLMGIVNASPDSFSDGGDLASLDAQVARARRLVDDGAAIVDVGGESGVTSTPVTDAEVEAARVVPLVARLAAEGITVSVDTWKPSVARAAISAGAAVVNDVSGLRDPDLARACAEGGAALVLMHTRAAPKTKAFPPYDDVVADVVAFLAERIELAVALGVERSRLVVDPGPDFAKTPAQTVEVLRRLGELGSLGRPVLLAASRKDFIGALTGTPPQERAAGTLAAVADGVERGATILRVHDVAGTSRFLRVRAALRGELEVPPDLSLAEHLRRRPPRR